MFRGEVLAPATTCCCCGSGDPGAPDAASVVARAVGRLAAGEAAPADDKALRPGGKLNGDGASSDGGGIDAEREAPPPGP
jgi:hypothetical protein